MKAKTYVLTAAGVTNWWRLDSKTNPVNVGYVVDCQGGGTYSYKLQHGYFSDSDAIQTDNLTRAGAVATLVFPSAHGLQVADSIVVIGSLGQGNVGSTMDGVFDVASVVNPTTITYTVTNSGPTTVNPGCVRVTKIAVVDDPIVGAGTATTKEGNIAFPVELLRVNAATVTTGALRVIFTQGHSA